MEKPATVGQIWDTTKTYMNSSMVKKYDGVLSPETSQGLGNFLMTNPKAMGLGISQEAKTDDRLQKYNIIQMYPTKRKDEFENLNDVYIITDEHGHDIGIYKADKNEFVLSDKIQKANEKIIGEFPESSRELLMQKYTIRNLEELTDKLAKGEEVVLASKEQAQDDIEEEYEKQGLAVGDGTTNQDPEEEKAIQALPADMRAEVIEQCRERNIKIKNVLVVDEPESVATQIGEKDNHIRPNGGPVILVQAKSGGLDSAEDVYMFQDGQELPDTQTHEDRLLELMNQNQNTGYVIDLEDNREDEILEALDQAILEYEEKMQIANSMPEGEDKDKAISFARETLKSEAYQVTEDYVPDSDGKVAQTLDAIEYETTPDSMEEIDKIEAMARDKISGVLGLNKDEDDGERSLWDEANPFNGPKK